mmetsp:Transcript_28763/g.37764  ORF Transcript_28763/g.37764 Transcript_28763/m.37764 type:complete len:402 (+) Transcript_28763:69-1274(+)|eukprot:CAMPEP_0117751740 /NCGR_PEP_ID=MMETSP0947-20121206/11162_1 /TAXON_ID=44440 /ORGANISM="Chattonella subsalsa, Strain CCMP2191" /LENGTH=401 /DNA_ID=CAMNT_0005570193 /DNA_START=67 /DNA_END=1272 /DNA_ORIENTATION=-
MAIYQRAVLCAILLGVASAFLPANNLKNVAKSGKATVSMHHHLSAERKADLERICEMMAAPGKGLTACDEGPLTIGARFEKVGIENTEEHRRAYRQMLFETPEIENYLSGAILDPETIFQKSSNSDKFFPEVLMEKGIVPGCKPHLKVYTIPGTPGETVMQGLDSLAVRLEEYKAGGCLFAKWRSPLKITNGQISDLCINSNMYDLARYALICQDVGLVPIVEPDIVMDGDHDLETAIDVNVKVQSVLYKAMLDHGVYMEGCILKSNMVNPGKSCTKAYTADEIGEANITQLKRCMPLAIRGANYLSGGQSLENAAARLNAINKAKGNCPWNLSFSWSWALQAPLFELAGAKGEGLLPALDEMGQLYLSELKIAGAAAKGEYEPKAGEGDHVPPKEVAMAA